IVEAARSEDARASRLRPPPRSAWRTFSSPISLALLIASVVYFWRYRTAPRQTDAKTMSMAGTNLEVVECGDGRPLLFLHAGEGWHPSDHGSNSWRGIIWSSRRGIPATATLH